MCVMIAKNRVWWDLISNIQMKQWCRSYNFLTLWYAIIVTNSIFIIFYNYNIYYLVYNGRLCFSLEVSMRNEMNINMALFLLILYWLLTLSWLGGVVLTHISSPKSRLPVSVKGDLWQWWKLTIWPSSTQP